MVKVKKEMKKQECHDRQPKEESRPCRKAQHHEQEDEEVLFLDSAATIKSKLTKLVK